MSDLLEVTEKGLYCPPGGFFVDPWTPVDRAIVTHAHADHARPGSRSYLFAEPGLEVMRERVDGSGVTFQPVAYGEVVDVQGVKVSLHPAGHILGSAQIRLEHGGTVWVVTGDYKRQSDPTCAGFEPVTADVLVTESTFGLPVYRWPEPAEVFTEIHGWWRANRAEGRTSVLFTYALGKAQRLLAGLEPEAPILVHGALHRLNQAYERSGISLPEHRYADLEACRAHRGEALVLAPPGAGGTSWMKRFGPTSTAFASGWMQVRGQRRRRAADRGFVLSDHVDWSALLTTIEESGAGRVGITHGFVPTVVRYLREQRGLDAWPVPTRFDDDLEAES